MTLSASEIGLKDLLANNTISGAPELTIDEGDGVLRCVACGHRCKIPEGRHGVCRVRLNRNGEMRVPGGYVAGVAVDPIEKKPFYHAYPGRDALSFGMLGCDLHCSYCQNWVSSQALRDDQAVSTPKRCDAEQLVEFAVRHGAPVMVSTYNEPLITSDWAMQAFTLAKAKGIVCGFVSNGNATPEVLEYLRPCVDLYKVDLKSFDDRNYRRLGGVLSNVLSSIEQLVEMGYWVEVVTLVVPGFNDGEDELRKIAEFLAGVSPTIPWHVTAFHPDYKMTDPPRTPVSTLIRAYEIGKDSGLHFVYPGNVHGGVGDRENTNCMDCGALLIRRQGFTILENRMLGSKCTACGADVPGVWEGIPPKQSDGTGIPRGIRV